MKSTVILSGILALIVCIPLGSTVQTRQSDEPSDAARRSSAVLGPALRLRVQTFNVKWGGTQQQRAKYAQWKAREAWVYETIRSFPSEVVCVQEVNPLQRMDIKACLPEFGMVEQRFGTRVPNAFVNEVCDPERSPPSPSDHFQVNADIVF